jgi:hypothetical protein
VARDIFDDVLRDLTSPEGGFYSAEDADSVVRAGFKEKAEGGGYFSSVADDPGVLLRMKEDSDDRRGGVYRESRE